MAHDLTSRAMLLSIRDCVNLLRAFQVPRWRMHLPPDAAPAWRRSPPEGLKKRFEICRRSVVVARYKELAAAGPLPSR